MNLHSVGSRRFLTASCSLAWLVCFIGTHLPSERVPSMPMDVTNNTLHIIGYTILASLFLLTMRSRSLSLPRRVAWAAGVLLAYAVFDEATQTFVAGRGASAWDVLADALGISLAIAADVLATLAMRTKNQTG